MTDKEDNPDTGSGQNGGYMRRKTDPPILQIFATVKYGLNGLALKAKFMQNVLVKMRIKSPDTSPNPPITSMAFGALGQMTIGANLRYSKHETQSYNRC